MTSQHTESEAGDGSDENGLGSTVLFFIALTAFLILLCLCMGLKYIVWKSKIGLFLRKCCGHIYNDFLCHERGIDISAETPPQILVCNEEPQVGNIVYQPSNEDHISLFSDPDSVAITGPDTSTRTEPRITETDSNISDNEVDQPEDERTSLLSSTAVSRFNEILERRGFHIDTNILEDIMNSVISEHSDLLNENRGNEGRNIPIRYDRINARAFDRELEEYQRLFEIIRTDMTENIEGSSRERTIIEELCRIIGPSPFDSSLSEDRSTNHPSTYNSLVEHNERDTEIPQPQSNSSAIVFRPPSNNLRNIRVSPPPFVSVGDSDNLPSYDDVVEENIPQSEISAHGTEITQPDNTSHDNIAPLTPDISAVSPEQPPLYEEYVYGVGYGIRNSNFSACKQDNCSHVTLIKHSFV